MGVFDVFENVTWSVFLCFFVFVCEGVCLDLENHFFFFLLSLSLSLSLSLLHHLPPPATAFQ